LSDVASINKCLAQLSKAGAAVKPT